MITEASKRMTEYGFYEDRCREDFELLERAYTEMKQRKNIGLIIIGGVGCGKTHAARALLRGKMYALTDSNILEYLQPYQDDGYVGWHKVKEQGSIVLDDLGNEQIKNDFGVKVDVVGNFILQWYSDRFQKDEENSRLSITTNLNEKQLLDRYGSRVIDRLYEMCLIVELKGTSHRKSAGRIV